MIIITRAGITDAQLDVIREAIETAGLQTHLSRGEHRTVIGCIGDERRLAEVGLAVLPGVESVIPVLKPYRQVSREFRADPTVVAVGDARGAAFGGEALAVIAGPCSVEGRAMLFESARAVRTAGATLLRGGAFKPRTSPYAFRGLGEEALEMLAAVRAETGMPVVTEVMDTRQVELVAEHADMLQVGARNMQNFALLSAVGDVRRPVLLKRGLSATIEELLLAAEYILARGNDQVVLCERGIRTFETATRNTLDVAAVPVLKRETHLPVIVDPSHAGGRADLVAPLSFAAIAAGADGLIIEVHPEPSKARSDADQSLTPEAFAELMGTLARFATAAGRTLPGADRRRTDVPGRAWRPTARFEAQPEHEGAIAQGGPMTVAPKTAAKAAPKSATKEPAATLAKLRARIERTDDALLVLLVRRAGLARAIGRAKQRAGLPVLDPAREARVVRRAATRARQLGMPQEDVRALFWAIIALCRAAQLPSGRIARARTAKTRGAARAKR